MKRGYRPAVLCRKFREDCIGPTIEKLVTTQIERYALPLQR